MFFGVKQLKQVVKPFKTRVKEELMQCALIYKSLLMDYEYLICSQAFKNRSYYIFYGTKDNFLHLTGVNTKLKAADFFFKCLDQTLTEDDFDFSKPNQSDKDVKGCVRKKLKVFPGIVDILKPGVIAEEQFSKGKIFCSFATATGTLTLGFIAPGKSRPKTLLEGNHLKNPKPVDLILRKPVNTELFEEIILGESSDLTNYLSEISSLISVSLL